MDAEPSGWLSQGSLADDGQRRIDEDVECRQTVTREARALLEALIKFLHLREGIVTEVEDNLTGDLGVQFTALCAKLLRDGHEDSPFFIAE